MADLEAYLLEMIKLTENYLALPDQEVWPRASVSSVELDKARSLNQARRAVVREAIERVTSERKSFLSDYLQGDIDAKKKQALSLCRCLYRTMKARQQVILEYEAAFLGVNILRGFTFSPAVHDFLLVPNHPYRLVTYGGEFKGDISWVEDLVTDMASYEEARWNYSRDIPYARMRDFRKRIWCDEGFFQEIVPDVSRFLNGKKRVLEVGFLHQRVYDIIMKINPEIEYHCVDICIPAVQIARRKGITSYNANCWYAIPYPNGFFDGVISTTVKASGFYHNKSAELARVLKRKRNILDIDMQ